MFPINQNPIAVASAKQQHFLDFAFKHCSFSPESPSNVISSLSSCICLWIFGYKILYTLVVLETQRIISC